MYKRNYDKHNFTSFVPHVHFTVVVWDLCIRCLTATDHQITSGHYVTVVSKHSITLRTSNVEVPNNQNNETHTCTLKICYIFYNKDNLYI